MDKTTIKIKLEEKLNRTAKPDELVNAEKDPIILIETLFEELEDIKSRLLVLENKK